MNKKVYCCSSLCCLSIKQLRISGLYHKDLWQAGRNVLRETGGMKGDDCYCCHLLRTKKASNCTKRLRKLAKAHATIGFRGALMPVKLDRIRTLIEDMRSEKYEDGRTLGEVASESAKGMREETPAAVLVNTALSINWNWKAAEKRVDRFYTNYPDVKSFSDLNELIQSMNGVDFCREVFDIAAQPGNPKHKRLKDLLQAFLDFKIKCGLKDDWETIQRWGQQVNIDNIAQDPIVRERPGIGLATVQNIKIVSGFDTSKPDRRIVQVLEQRFKMNLGMSGSKLSNAVHKMEELSKLTGYKCIELDQLFWYWLDQPSRMT